jgi:M6 family metalloprotease-like protein
VGVSLCLFPAWGASLSDFGYNNLKVNGVLPLAPRPLLVILVNFPNSPPITNPPSYYDQLIFNSTQMPSMNGYFQAVSNGRFSFSRGGVIGPLSLSAAERNDPGNWPNDGAYHSNIVYKAMVSGLFDFASYDVNHDGHVTQDELAIIDILNEGNYFSVGARTAGVVKPAGSSVDWGAGRQPNLAGMNYQTPVIVMVEETEETLGAIDIYGADCLSKGLTPQSCAVNSGPNTTEVYYLDPWHRMQLGWCEPRIFPVGAGGYATLPAAQMGNPTAPLILYDPSRGTSEFFMLEYRTTNSPNGSGYDANVADNGLVLWRVQQDGSHEALTIPRVDAGPLPAQGQWRFCSKCNGLHYITSDTSPSYGPCPQGGMHVGGTTPYQVVVNNGNAPGQHGWRLCSKCQGMFFGPNQSGSQCPAGGTHDGSSSGDYSFVQNDSTSPGQQNWRWCQKCQGMFYAGTDQSGNPMFAAGVCPVSGQHDGTASGNYAVLLSGLDRAVWSEGPPIVPPRFGRGNSTAWHGGDLTPYLRWSDGTQTQVQLFVRPFNPGDGSITVEWRAEYDTWVDFNWNFIENGTFNFPFNTLVEGLGAVTYGGNLYFKSGTTPETAYINKRMIMRAYGGPVTLGR